MSEKQGKTLKKKEGGSVSAGLCVLHRKMSEG